MNRLGELERAIMDVLWEAANPLSVREVSGLLTDRDLAHTTVMTVLDRLAKKGFARRERSLVTKEQDLHTAKETATITRRELGASATRSDAALPDRIPERVSLLHRPQPTLLPDVLDRPDPGRDPQQIDRALAEHLVCDVSLTTPRVPGLGPHRTRSVTRCGSVPSHGL